MNALPVWIDREAWDGYVAMRETMKKPMTARAETLVLKTLYQLKERGHDPNAALDQSTVHNWIDVYQPKAKEMDNLIKTYYQPEAPQTEAEREASSAAKRKVMDAILPAIRRVA
jgi:Mg2+ and Co2+ transporter CorA